MKSLILQVVFLGATGIVGREAAKPHQHGGMSFRWLNNQVVWSGKSKELKN